MANLHPKVKDHEYPEELHFAVVGNLTFTTSGIDNVVLAQGGGTWLAIIIGRQE